MQPTLCSRCKKNVAVVFISKIEGDKTINEGLCLKCAKDLGLPQVDDMMKRMGISDEDLDTLNSEMMQAMNGVENIEDLPGGDGHLPVSQPALLRGKRPGIRRRRGGDFPWSGKGAPEGPQKRQAEIPGELLHLPDPEGQRGKAGPCDRPYRGDRAGGADPQPPSEEQPLSDR